MARSTRYRSVPYIAAGDAFISKARDISVQDTRNMYVLATPNSNTPAALISYPGLKPWSTGGAVGDDRGMHRREFKGLGYHVAGGTLYSISGGGQRNAIGAIAGGERVSWADNGQVLLIVAGSKMYQYDGSSLTVVNTVSESGNTFTPTDVDYLNDKFIALSTDGLIYVANVGETNFVNGFYDAESSPDSTLALQVFDQTILNFGTESIEPWQDAGTGKPPLSRVDGGIIENTGIANKNAVDITADAVYFLGRDMIPYALRNFLAEKLTGQNPGIAELFRGYDRDTATVSALKWKGQEFIQFRFPLDNKVWVFSPNTGLWFQLDHGVNKALYKGGSTAFLFNKQIVADYETGSLYELDDDTHTNNGDVIVRERTFRPLSANTLGLGRTALQMKSIQYEVETGVGVNDENPQMIVQYSIDGGRSFINERWLRLGKAGDYIAIEDNSNRKFNDLVVKIKYTEPTAFTIYNAHIYVREAGRLISRKVSSQVGDFPYVPPILPFVWSDDNKAPDTFTTKANDGKLNVSIPRDGAGLRYKYAFTTPFNLMSKYSGKIYFEVQVNNFVGTSTSPDIINYGLYPASTVEDYESSTTYQDNPRLSCRWEDGGLLFPTEIDVTLVNPVGGNVLAPSDWDIDSVREGVFMFALDVSTSTVKLWRGVNGSWIEGDPSTDTNPWVSNNNIYNYLDYDFYFFAYFDNVFDNSGALSFDMTIFGNEDNPFNYTVPTGFNGT